MSAPRKQKTNNRPILIPFPVNAEEDEFLKRAAFSQFGVRWRVARYMRERLLPTNWKAMLSQLRRLQGPQLP